MTVDDHEPTDIAMQVMAAFHNKDRLMKRRKDPAEGGPVPRRRRGADSDAALDKAQEEYEKELRRWEAAKQTELIKKYRLSRVQARRFREANTRNPDQENESAQ